MNDKFMKLAIKQALIAKEKDEVPIGAVIVVDDKVIAKAYNQMEKTQQATAHAEILAIQKACKKLKSWRLDNAEMYVTVEPCAMCAGAIINARIKRLYVGACEPKTGACVSKVNLLKEGLFNHNVDTHYGIGEEESQKLMKEFFTEKR